MSDFDADEVESLEYEIATLKDLLRAWLAHVDVTDFAFPEQLVQETKDALEDD